MGKTFQCKRKIRVNFWVVLHWNKPLTTVFLYCPPYILISDYFLPLTDGINVLLAGFDPLLSLLFSLFLLVTF